MKRADFDDIIKAALISLASGQLLNATTLPAGPTQDKRIENDIDVLIQLEGAWQRAVAKKFEDSTQ